MFILEQIQQAFLLADNRAKAAFQTCFLAKLWGSCRRITFTTPSLSNQAGILQKLNHCTPNQGLDGIPLYAAGMVRHIRRTTVAAITTTIRQITIYSTSSQGVAAH